MRTLFAASALLGVLFPTPLHLVRRVEDPIAQSQAIVEEFCAGDRIVSITGQKIVIVDYAQQTLTEIDHALRTYSITTFAAIASRPAVPDSKPQVKVEVDRSVMLSREAVEALVGASYPNQHLEQHDRILSAAAPPGGRIAAQSASQPQYGLPSDTSVTFDDGVVVRNVIVRIDHDLPPPQLMMIDPGATRVESRLTRTARELKELDHPPRP